MIKTLGVLVLLLAGFVLFLFLSGEAPPRVSAPDSAPVAELSGKTLEPAATAREHRPGRIRHRNELGQALPFRKRNVELLELENLKAARVGDRIVLDFFPDVRIRARVDLRDTISGELRVAGPLEGFGNGDRFFLTSIPDEGRLLVEIPSRNLAYEIAWDSNTRPVAQEWLFTDVVCASPLE